MKARNSLFSGSMTGLVVFFLIVVPFAVQAGVRTAVVVDGQYDDWDLNEDRSRPVPAKHRARCTCNVVHSGRQCIGEEIPNVYLRYDSITNTVFVLVLQKDSIQDGRSKPIVNIYTLGQNIPIEFGESEKISDFSWVMSGGKRVGWEGAFQLAPGTYDCDTNSKSGKGVETVPERTRTSEVEVIDTEGLIKCN